MLIPSFIVIAAILFIVGILMIAKGASIDETKVEAISDPTEIEQLKNIFQPQQRQENRLQEDSTPMEETPVVPAQSGDQILYERMESESEQLQKQIQDKDEQIARLEKDFDALKAEHEKVKDQTDEVIKNLQEKVDRYYQEKEQVTSDNSEEVEQLKSKNVILQQQIQESRDQQAKAEAALKQLKAEYEQVQRKVDIAEGRAADLQAEINAVKETGEKNLQAAHETIDELKAKQEDAGRSDFVALGDQMADSVAIIEQLKEENKDLLATIDQLKNEFKETGELNTQLLENEKMMQYELTKNRAQALGLEKLCEDFRVQIETLSAPEA